MEEWEISLEEISKKAIEMIDNVVDTMECNGPVQKTLDMVGNILSIEGELREETDDIADFAGRENVQEVLGDLDELRKVAMEIKEECEALLD